MNLMQTIFTLGALQGLFLVAAIWRKAAGSAANRWLAVWMLCLVYLLVCAWLYQGGLLANHIDYYAAIEFDLFLMGPLLLFYVRSIIDPNWRADRRWGLLFLPAAVSLPLFLLFRFGGGTFLRVYYENAYPCFLSATVYLCLAIAAIVRNRQSFLDWMYVRQRLVWVVSLVGLYAVGWVASILVMVLFTGDGSDEAGFRLLHALTALNITAEIYLLGYFALSHPILFPDKLADQAPPADVPVLAGEDTEAEYRRIRAQAERLVHRNPALTLDQFARKAGVAPPARVSQILRKHEGKLFNDWLNSQRLADFTDLLARPDQRGRSILDICYEAGFNSKATFYRVFKEKLGMSPLEYRQKLEQSGETG